MVVSSFGAVICPELEAIMGHIVVITAAVQFSRLKTYRLGLFNDLKNRQSGNFSVSVSLWEIR